MSKNPHIGIVVGSTRQGRFSERAAAWFYDVRHGVARDLHAIARNRILTGRALGYAPDGGLDFGLARAGLATAGSSYGILFHATARPEKEWPEASWIALGRALAARGSALVLPWGTQAEHARSSRIAAAVGNAARVPDRQPLDRMARLVAGASFVVGVDTGLLHLAAARSGKDDENQDARRHDVTGSPSAATRGTGTSS